MAPTGSDSNPGTQSAPFKTIAYASKSAKPDTIVHVAPGTYAGGFQTNASGTATGRIRYLSDTKWGAKIVPPANSSGVIAWDNRGAYVDIDGFEVDGTNYQSGTRWLNGIIVRGAYDVVMNSHVHHIGSDPSQCTGSGGSGIYGDVYYGATNIDMVDNVVHHIGSASCYYIQGIYHTATGSIKNNVVYAVGAYGIHLWHNAHNINVVNNTVFGSGYGMVVGGGNFYNGYTAGAVNVNVSNNIIFDNTNIGIKESGTYGTSNTYTNNLVYQNGSNLSLGSGKSNVNGIGADPQFVSYVRSGGGDYRLRSTSPAIDKGSKTYAPATDIVGTTRPQGANIDIGAYEYSGQ